MGKIVKIIKENGMVKSVIIETGLGANKSTLEFDVTCIAYSLTEHAVPAVEEKKEETKEEAKEETAETKTEEVKEEKKPAAKKSSKKSK